MSVTDILRDPEQPTVMFVTKLDAPAVRAWQLWADPANSSAGGDRPPIRPRSWTTT